MASGFVPNMVLGAARVVVVLGFTVSCGSTYFRVYKMICV
jgi:hypothetical protein